MVLDRSKETVRERDDWNQADGTMEDKKMETETIKERSEQYEGGNCLIISL